MAKQYILFNPLAGNGVAAQQAHELAARYQEPVLCDMTTIEDYKMFFRTLTEDDEVILCGGDGTLNRLAQSLSGMDIRCPLYYYAVGSGNDFARDLGKEQAAAPVFPINDYLKNLPTVTVNGKESVFINGVGYGIDGYCCEVGDELRKTTDKPINYAGIAIKGLLFHYKPTSAKITVDGKTRTYKKVWIAPTMNGRFYGGGMMPTPNQDRLNHDRTLSLMVLHDSGKLKTLCVFPSIFKGEHIRHTDIVDILVGHDITVEFDRPVALQIDGETVLGVSSYHAVSSAHKKVPATV